MKKVAILIACGSIAVSSYADLTWQSSGNLLGNIPDISYPESGGWLVQMYRDVGDNTDLSTISFDLDGNPTSGDDIRLSDWTLELNAYVAFGETVDFTQLDLPFASIAGFSVYTVILDTDSWANASTLNRTFVLDDSTYQVTSISTDEAVYNVPHNNPGEHEWQQVIPEPGTMALLLMGMTGLFGLRRKLSA